MSTMNFRQHIEPGSGPLRRGLRQECRLFDRTVNVSFSKTTQQK